MAGRRRSVLDELSERSVLSLIAEGRSNRAVAKQLYLSSRAIERHVQAIFQKLGLPDLEDDNRRVLAVLALLAHLGRARGHTAAGPTRLLVGPAVLGPPAVSGLVPVGGVSLRNACQLTVTV